MDKPLVQPVMDKCPGCGYILSPDTGECLRCGYKPCQFCDVPGEPDEQKKAGDP